MEGGGGGGSCLVSGSLRNILNSSDIFVQICIFYDLVGLSESRNHLGDFDIFGHKVSVNIFIVDVFML